MSQGCVLPWLCSTTDTFRLGNTTGGKERSEAQVGKSSHCDKKCRRIVQSHPGQTLHPGTLILITYIGMHLIPHAHLCPMYSPAEVNESRVKVRV